jgi:hypothetical protein
MTKDDLIWLDSVAVDILNVYHHGSIGRREKHPITIAYEIPLRCTRSSIFCRDPHDYLLEVIAKAISSYATVSSHTEYVQFDAMYVIRFSMTFDTLAVLRSYPAKKKRA